MRIANWLTLNGIEWEYERTYPVATATRSRRAYKPDFYLPAHDLYIEHFGVDRAGRTAPHIDSADYQRAMAWKRSLHEQHGTRLVETYSYYQREGIHIAKLQELLHDEGVEIHPLTQEQIDEITAEVNRPFSDFIGTLTQFLSLFKGSGASRTDVAGRVRTERDRAFLDIFWALFDRYEEELLWKSTIDFDDMINKARDYVRSGEYRSPYKYIVIDEFQDISKNRLGLLQDLRAQHRHGRLFAVRDDWQSIYRFAGSDVGIITHLPVRVGATARVDLDIAFRYPQELLDVSSRFVMRNDAQLSKTLRAYQGGAGLLPVCLIFEPSKSSDSNSAYDVILDDISRQAEGQSSSVYMLGRYGFNNLSAFDELQRRFDQQGLTLNYLTAHSSKGMESDFIVLVGLESGEYGFPSIISDDPAMHMVLSDTETFPYAEERRLFYVAITRARRRVYLVAPEDRASLFVQDDILGEHLRPFIETIGEVSDRHHCPKCQGKAIRRTQGQYGSFWSCANYPLCHRKLDTCPSCKEGGLITSVANQQISAYHCTDCSFRASVCPKCGKGYLAKRSGKYGEFLGCSRWNGGEGCLHTQRS